MISIPAGSRIWLVAGITDMRNGFNGLASKVQNVLKDDPFSGHLFIFRGLRLAGHPRWKGSPYSGSVVHAS